MSKMFVPCKGKTACQENDSQCRTCGRSLDEIYGTRALVDDLVSFAQEMDYENTDIFLEYVAAKAFKKIRYLKQQTDLGNTSRGNHEHH